MKVTKAKAMGTCFGVRDALTQALGSPHRNDLTILGQLVHNPQTVERLKEAGIRVVGSIDDPILTHHVMITAHGASEKVKRELLRRGFVVDDATCPLVTRVHQAIQAMAREGLFPVVIGQIDHVEVKGIVGDLAEYAVVASVDQIGPLRNHSRIGIVAQTTQQIRVADQIVEAIRAQGHEEVRYLNTICKPTRDRQEAVEELARQVDVMLVIGGHNSSNTIKLKLVCDRIGVPTHHIERKTEIDPRWFVGKAHAGITAGTSTPDEVIEEVYQYLLSL